MCKDAAQGKAQWSLQQFGILKDRIISMMTSRYGGDDLCKTSSAYLSLQCKTCEVDCWHANKKIPMESTIEEKVPYTPIVSPQMRHLLGAWFRTMVLGGETTNLGPLLQQVWFLRRKDSQQRFYVSYSQATSLIFFWWSLNYLKH